MLEFLKLAHEKILELILILDPGGRHLLDPGFLFTNPLAGLLELYLFRGRFQAGDRSS